MPLIGPSSHSVMANLRTNPDATLLNHGFLVESSVYTTVTIGGGCTPVCSHLSGQVYKLAVGKGAGDWFYPYINATQGGVGVCIVPVGQAEGTLALTGGMNGCALQVNKSGNDFYFYHDSNGESLKGKLTPGDVVCRVAYRDYAGPLEIGLNSAAKHTNASTKTYYSHSIICVRLGGKWKVYVSGVLTGYTDGFFGMSRSYSTFRPTVSPLIASFDDS